MGYTIAKSFGFEASHRLDGLPPGHQCGRLHGHSYQFTVELTAPALDPTGFVVDYGELAPVKALVDAELDHRHLNHVLAGSPLVPATHAWPYNPTAERLAWWLFQRIAPMVTDRGGTLLAVRVHETAKTWAEYRPAPPPTLGMLPLAQVA